MSRLAGIEHPRFLRERPTGAPAWLAGHETLSLLGQERHFHDRVRIDALLKVVADELLLDRDVWGHQKWFFENLFRSFFRDSDDPAWIKISPARWSFHQRLDAPRRGVLHEARLGRRLFSQRHLGRERLWMNDTSVPTTRLLMHHRSGRQDGGLRVRQLFVERVVRDDGLGPPIVGSERWTLLSADDRDERRALRRGLNISLEEFRDPMTWMQTAPLISLCRVADAGRWIIHRCFSLRPGPGEGSGQVIDFRTCDYSLEYYFRSDLTTHTMLERLLTRGVFELF